MKAKEIEVGGVYVAKVSGRLVQVRVDGIRKIRTYNARQVARVGQTGIRQVYDVTNLRTKRQTVFQSAAKFRSAVQL